MKKLSEEKAKELVAAVFAFEQELQRGTWDNETHLIKLIDFAENFKRIWKKLN